jgi:hypothetical protein
MPYRTSPVLAASPFNWPVLLATRPSVPPFLEEVAPAKQAASIATGASASAGSTLADVQQQVQAVVTQLLGPGEQMMACVGYACPAGQPVCRQTLTLSSHMGWVAEGTTVSTEVWSLSWHHWNQQQMQCAST